MWSCNLGRVSRIRRRNVEGDGWQEVREWVNKGKRSGAGEGQAVPVIDGLPVPDSSR